MIDGGFSPGFYFPSWSLGYNINVPNKEKCGEGKTDCPFLGICWEVAWHFPCENHGVTVPRQETS